MKALEQPRIGNRSDALELLDELIEMAGAGTNKALALGLEVLKDAVAREVV